MDLSDSKVRRRVNKRFREKRIPAKACGKCFVVKGHAAFSVARRENDGRASVCAACNRAGVTIWNAANPSRRAANRRQWRAANRDRKAETDRQWRIANPDKVRAYSQATEARNALVPTEPFTASDLRHDWEEHDLYACVYCGGSLPDGYDVEHFYPKFPDDEETTPAGPHALWNLVPSCAPCNRGVNGKHSREPWQFLRDSLAEQGVDLDACFATLDAIAARRRRKP
ncbi:hypothetical protein [Streptomyces sp. NPDC005302]|uniref:hypothetical protein n=1 Tax=Streptomyces sp. NPDC005302 TaxID=3154675 RepID=UPI0033AA66B2